MSKKENEASKTSKQTVDLTGRKHTKLISVVSGVVQ